MRHFCKFCTVVAYNSSGNWFVYYPAIFILQFKYRFGSEGSAMRMCSVWRVVVLVSLLVLSACGTTTAVTEPATATAVTEPATATAVIEPATATAVIEPATATAVTEPATATAVPKPATATAVIDPATATVVVDPAMDTVVTDTATLELQPFELQTRAVQVLLDYYGAINQKQYLVAYALLVTPNQTLAQFAAQYENNIDSRLWVGAPEVDGDVVTIAVTVVTAVNQKNGDQGSQWTNETYTFKNNLITNVVIVPTTQRNEPSPEQLMVNYYDVRYNVQKSYQLLPMSYTMWQYNGGASGMSYTEFVDKMTVFYPEDVFVGEAQIDGGAGTMEATVPVVEAYSDADGFLRGYSYVFCGTYTLRSSDVPPFDQFGWQITQFNIERDYKANLVLNPKLKLSTKKELNVPIFQKLMKSGCTP